MTDEGLPFLRGKIERSEAFTTARGGGGDTPTLPPRNPIQHRGELIAQLDQIATAARARDPQTRDPEATRELIAVHPEPGSQLEASSLGDANSDVRVVGVDPDNGVVLIDAPNAELPALRKKLDEFADASKLSPKKQQPMNAPLIAPIKEVRAASIEEVGSSLLTAMQDGAPRWVELVCRGGIYDDDGSKKSRREIERQLDRLAPESRIAAQFTAPFQVVFYTRLTLQQLRELVAATDCVFDAQLAEAKIRDWLLHEYDDELDLSGFSLTPPDKNAPCVVLLDTGIQPAHPLLANAIASIGSVVPGITSGVDVDGHGTQMAGVALHGSTVGDAIDSGTTEAPHWLQAIKVNTSESNSGDEHARATWPPMTIAAVEQAEAAPVKVGRRVFAMAVTAEKDPLVPTTWSQAIEQIAYNNGNGRVFCISAGNADSGNVNVLNGYPQLNLVQPMQDPAQAWNALTIGAFTQLDQLPTDDRYKAYSPVAPRGGISPHSSSRPLDATRVPNKPEIVLEGGNVAFDGMLPDPTVTTLTTLTTGHRPNRPLAAIWATSGATAHAAQLAASVWKADPTLRPETVRGLIVHAASWTEQMETHFESLDDRMRICGYGVPDPNFSKWCARERATVIIEDSMPNAVMVDKPRKTPPKRATTPPTRPEPERIAKFFRLPLDQETLLANDEEVELRVTLSYFAEVQTYRRRAYRGLDLRWDMQGPQESEDQFRRRINKKLRTPGAEQTKTKTFKWHIGPTRREEGTVQSDRWTGKASLLAGPKLIAVMPNGGWWDQYLGFRTKELPFSLIVTVRTTALDIYSLVEIALRPTIAVPV
jgi:Subtilase family